MKYDKKIFDDFIPVDCTNCEEWWLNKCDGVTIGTERRCTAFKATRREDISQRIKSLRMAIKWLYVAVVLEAVAILVLGMMIY